MVRRYEVLGSGRLGRHVSGGLIFALLLTLPGLLLPSSTLAAVAGTIEFHSVYIGYDVSAGESQGSTGAEVVRTQGSQGSVGVTAATVAGGTATGGASCTAGVDYVDKSMSLAWADGEVGSKVLFFSVCQDAAVEPNETVNIAISSPTGGATLGTLITLTVTIVDDDAAGAGTIEFHSVYIGYDVSAGESQGSTGAEVVRTQGSQGSVGVTAATVAGGTATGGASCTAGVDYVDKSMSLAWADGAVGSKVLFFSVCQDAAVEPNETVNIAISSPTGGATLGTLITLTVTIVDDDAAVAGTIEFHSVYIGYDVSAGESQGSTGAEVVRTQGSQGSVGVTAATVAGGTATGGASCTAGVDYVDKSMSLAWADGEVGSKVLFFSVCQDAAVEPNETVNIAISSPTGGATLGTLITLTVTIVDDDTYNTAPIVDAGTDATVAEGANVNLNGSVVDAEDLPTIAWSASPGIDVDAGAVCTFSAPSSATSDVSCTDDGAWNLTLTADDGTEPPVSDSLTLSVTNALPVVNAGADRFVSVGDTVSLAPATFTDGGTNDTHGATINWGDGTIEPGVVSETNGSGTVAGSHNYSTTGLYTATVIVTDDDSDAGSDTVKVLVDPPAPPNRILASDGTSNDYYGRSAAISGDTMVVGAPSDGPIGVLSGSVYVYERNSAGDWNEIAKLVPSDGSELDQFGWASAIAGDVIVVGAYGDRDKGHTSGSAYVFERNGSGDWIQVDKLLASDGVANHYFGISVAVSGDRIVVGAEGDSHNGQRSGAAYVFDRNGAGDWLQTSKLIASDGVAFDTFGHDVAISGDRIVVSAILDDATAPYAGSAYLFERDSSGTWIEQDKLLAPDGIEGHNFGESVAISGDHAVVGAYGDAEQGLLAGAAYVFERSGSGDWTLVDKLLASDGVTDQWMYLGISVSISGNRIAAGAAYANGNKPSSGAAYIYKRDASGHWVEVDKIFAADGVTGDVFGYTVALDGNTVVAGSSSDDNVGGLDAGSAYVFELAPLNTAPAVEAGADAAVVEGASVSLTGSVVDAEDLTPTITWSASPGIGVDSGAVCTFSVPNSATTDVSCTDDGTWTLTLTADDGTDPPVSDSLTLSVTNALPVVNAGADRFLSVGDTVSLAPATFTDAGSHDTHTATINWGDGTTTPGTITEANGSGTVAGSHVYTSSGLFTATVTVTDDDTGAGSDSAKMSVQGLAFAIAFHGSTTAVVSGTTLSLTRPVGAAPGDVLIASIDIRGTPTIVDPTGWTLVMPAAVRTTPIKHTKATYWHLVGAADPATYAWTFSVSSSSAAILLAYGGVDSTAPIDVMSNRTNTGISPQVNATDVITTVNGAMLVALFGIADGTSFTPPTGMTERADVSQTSGGTTSKVTAEAADQLRPIAGPTGGLVRTATSLGNGYGIGQLIVLRPGLPLVPDDEAPTIPQNLVGSAPIGSEVHLSWSASTDNVGVHHYLIQRAVVTGGTPGAFTGIGQSTTTTYVDMTVDDQTSYRYVIRAVDASSNSSSPSVYAGVTTPIAIEFHGSTTAVASGTSISLARPVAAVPGDVLIASIDIRGTPTIGAPSGWTLVMTPAVRTAPIKHTKATYWHLVGAADPATYAWTFSVSSSAAAILLSYGGVDPTSPIDIASNRTNTGITSPVNATDVTTTVNGAMLIALFGIADGASFTPPTGMTERADVSQASGGTTSHVSAEAADELRPTAGPTGASATSVRSAISTGNGYGIGQLIVLRPGT